MKIEKVNENQIRCTLSKTDLQNRQIRISELAYGSEKARTLFRDMIQQANQEFGFEVEDIPLMIEAIPTSAESVILLITKVEYPEELDTRFSKFTEADADLYGLDEFSAENDAPVQGADDVLGWFEKLHQEKESADGQEEPDAGEKTVSGRDVRIARADLTKMFEFSDMEQLIRLAGVLDGYYVGENDLYKNVRKNRFYLLIHSSEHTPQEFNKVCNMISEYARQKNYNNAMGAFFEEHGRLIIKGNALQTLAAL
jgi:adapter protein MecA 1/2